MSDELKLKMLGKPIMGACDVLCKKCLIVFTAIQGRIASCPKCGDSERWGDMLNVREESRFVVGCIDY